MLESPGIGVTLCCIDCANQPLSIVALKRSMAALPFGDVLFLTDRSYNVPGVRVEQIPPIRDRVGYSNFVLKQLRGHISTTHVLLIQWDGYIVNPSAWADEFLQCDYIGAPWGWYKDAYRVGNGGFSLRSRRLLDALADPEITAMDPEDEAICRRYRPLLEERYGIRFAPEDVAMRFSFETTYPQEIPFGFHGLYNMWLFIADDEFDNFLAQLSPEILRSRQLLQLGRNYKDLGRLREAAEIFRRRLRVVPDDTETKGLLAGLEQPKQSAARTTRRNEPCRCGSGKRFKECCGRSNATATASSQANRPGVQEMLQVAIQSHQAGRTSHAEALYEQILRLDESENPFALHYLGVIRMQQGQLDQAEQLIRRSLVSAPQIPDFHNNLGLCLRAEQRLEEAVAAYRRALDLNPSYSPAWSNIGLDLHKLGRLDEALDAFNRALVLEPSLPQARFSRALVLLAQGDYAEGWKEYEWRAKCPEHAGGYRLPPMVGSPLPWQGEALAGRSLLLIAEQGIGDTLQFIRYTRQLADLGARVSLYVRKRHLVDFVRSAPSLSDVYTTDRTEPIPAHDYTCPLLSLPRLCGTLALEDVPATVPYLFVPAARREFWRRRLRALAAKLRIGLSWAGSPGNPDDRNRSCPLTVLTPLLELSAIAWINLQLGPGREQIQTLQAPIHDWGDEQINFAETAALMAELDLIITVDTSIAHAAGALGIPVWIMLTHVPDFRWLMRRNDSPWYPTARLFRQTAPGDWASVVKAMRSALMDGKAVTRVAR
jgi:tetratricopeptide (TPR) repeat protein